MSKSKRPARAPAEPLDDLMTFLNTVDIEFGDTRRGTRWNIMGLAC